MKKSVLYLAIIFTFTILMSSFASAANLPLRVVVNGQKINFPDAQPFVDAKGRTQVPSRFIAEALGAETTWNPKEQKAKFEVGDNKLELKIGQMSYLLNGKTLKMDTVAMIKDARTYVPARYVAEAFNADLRWDQTISTLYIQTNATGEVKPTPSTAPQVGTTKSYGGITFNDVSDLDEYGRMSEEKTKEFIFKLTDQLTFVKEDGKYVIKCEYPELPKGFEWKISIRVHTKNDSANFTYGTKLEKNLIPTTGKFTKVVPYVKNENDVTLYGLALSIGVKDYKIVEGASDSIAGLLDVTKSKDGILRAGFIPRSSGTTQYFEDFDFDRMFQW